MEHPLSLAEAECAAVRAALAYTHGKKTTAAQILGCTRSTLDRLIVRYGLTEESPAKGAINGSC